MIYYIALFLGLACGGVVGAAIYIVNKHKKQVWDVMDENERIKGIAEKQHVENQGLLARYGNVYDLDKYYMDVKRDAADLKSRYIQAQEYYKQLEHEVETYKDDLEFFDFGLYKPQYSFDTSEAYKQALDQNRAKQKALLKNGQAISCDTEWEVGGSKAEGKKMTQRNIKLVMRAFNGECDTAAAKVKWNNATRMKERIIKAFDQLNKLGEPLQVAILPEYLDAKIEELNLGYEFENKKQEEKEEQRQIREMMREEEKVKREAEKAQKKALEEERKAQEEERIKQAALAEARKQFESAHEDEQSELAARIADLEREVEEAHTKIEEAHVNSERAMSQAQLTKQGHVYVISNVGSFGDGIYKIGMTRRLEPMDRVKELGDASVPFIFDVHALIFSKDAPALESALHRQFTHRRVNLINKRKEFFNVSIQEIEQVLTNNHLGELELTKIATAEEYRQSEAMRNRNTSNKGGAQGHTHLTDSIEL